LHAASIAESTDPINLQFRPDIGAKRTLCVTWRLTSACNISGGHRGSERSTAWTVELEPVARHADGSTTVRVGIRRIQDKTAMLDGDQRHSMFELDSAENKHETKESMAAFAAFLHATFTARLSAQGRVVDIDTRDFYARVAENRLLFENEVIRSKPQRIRAARKRYGQRVKDAGFRVPFREPEDPETVVRKRNNKYGSARKRQQAYETEAPNSSLYGTAALTRLMNHLAPSLAAEPLHPGDRWTAPVMICIEAPVEMTATHTLQDIDDDSCTVQAQAFRTPEDKPVTDEQGRVHKGVNLRGNYLSTITVDRTTGQIRHKKAVMDLTGTVRSPAPPEAGPPRDIPANIQITLTVEPVE
jgi:hypothetical protein